MKNKLNIFLTAVIFLTGSVCAGAQQKEEMQNAIITAVEHFTEADYTTARAILDSLENSGFEDDAMEYYLGLCDICDRKYDSAEKHMRKAVSMDSTNYWYHDWLANILVGTGQTDPAIAEYESMLAAYPKKNELYFNLVSLYAKKGDFEKVLTTLDTIETVFGKSDMVVSARMDILNRMGRYADVIAMLDEIAGDPGEDPQRVLQALGSELTIYYGQEDYKSVISVAQRMALAFSDSAEIVSSAYSTMGDAYYMLGKRGKAYKCYDKVLKILPGHNPTLNNYAYFLSQEGRQLGKAYKMSRITIETEPDNATYLDTFGWILHLQGKDLEAKPFFKHAMIYGGKDSSTVLAHYAAVLRSLGENDLAVYYEGLAAKKKEEGK